MVSGMCWLSAGQGRDIRTAERDINIVKIHIDNVSSPGTHYPVMIGWSRDNITAHRNSIIFCWLLIN